VAIYLLNVEYVGKLEQLLFASF